jgi:methyl coenzyme M reductase subunit C
MTRDLSTGGPIDSRGMIVRTHRAELLASAAAERTAHVAKPSSKPTVRRQLGRTLVRIGRALADEPRTGRPGPIAS